jgi:hypothetical protein
MFTPLRPRDFDMEIIQRAARFVTHGRQAMHLRLFLFWHFFDAQQISEALDALREVELVYEKSPSNIIADLHANFIVGCALLQHDAERAHLWWDRMEAQKVVPRNADLMARCALLWSEGHIEEAQQAWGDGNVMV